MCVISSSRVLHDPTVLTHVREVAVHIDLFLYRLGIRAKIIRMFLSKM